MNWFIRHRHSFEHRGFHSGLGQIVGMLAIVFAAVHGEYEWLKLTAPVYLLVVMCVSIYFHRLVAHGSWLANKYIEYGMLAVCTAVGSGSWLQWRVAHRPHHKYSDGPGDPHNLDRPWAFWLIRYHQPKYEWDADTLSRMQNPVFRFMHRQYWIFNISVALILALIDWHWLFYGYVLPCGLALIMGGIHNVVAHRGDGTRRFPLDLWLWMPFSCGEWLHGTHHEHPGRWNFSDKWYKPDPGAWVIMALRSVGLARTGAINKLNNI